MVDLITGTICLGFVTFIAYLCKWLYQLFVSVKEVVSVKLAQPIRYERPALADIGIAGRLIPMTPKKPKPLKSWRELCDSLTLDELFVFVTRHSQYQLTKFWYQFSGRAPEMKQRRAEVVAYARRIFGPLKRLHPSEWREHLTTQGAVLWNRDLDLTDIRKVYPGEAVLSYRSAILADVADDPFQVNVIIARATYGNRSSMFPQDPRFLPSGYPGHDPNAQDPFIEYQTQ